MEDGAEAARAEACAESDEQRERGDSFNHFCGTAGCNRRSSLRSMHNEVCCDRCDASDGARHTPECDGSDAAWRAWLAAKKNRDRPSQTVAAAGSARAECHRRRRPPRLRRLSLPASGLLFFPSAGAASVVGVAVR